MEQASAVVIKRDDGITHSQLAETEKGQPDVKVAAMSAAYAVVVRSLRVFAQSFMGILSAQGMGAVDAILGAQVTPHSFWDKVVVAFWFALAPAAFTILQNAAELIIRLDEKMPRWRACFASALLIGSLMACAKPPVDLTPEALVAFRATQAVKVLDVLRDAAIDANATKPPLLSEATTRKVVLYHQATVKITRAAPEGWVPVAKAGLEELERNLTGAEKDHLVPYVRLVKAVLEATR